MKLPMIQIGDLIARRSGSVNPAKHPDEAFDLYSVPAFDTRRPECIAGKADWFHQADCQTKRCHAMQDRASHSSIMGCQGLQWASVSLHPVSGLYLEETIFGQII